MYKHVQSVLFLLLAAILLAACGAREAPAEEPEVEAAPALAEESMAKDSAYGEAPMLAEMVEAGTLPPVDERLPLEPLVIEPFNEIGQYGGTWHRFDTSSRRLPLCHGHVCLFPGSLGTGRFGQTSRAGQGMGQQ